MLNFSRQKKSIHSFSTHVKSYTIKNCDLEIQPGKNRNYDLVKFLMNDYKLYNFSTRVLADKQEERVFIEGCLRNLRKRCDSND